MYAWINELAEDVNFQTCTPLPEGALQEQYNLELVLRFLALRKLEDVSSVGTDVNEFLTEEMLKVAQNSQFDFTAEEQAFKGTFSILANAMADNSFKRYEQDKDKFMGGFLIPAFETIASGVGYNYKKLLSEPGTTVENKVKELWRNEEIFLKYARGGIPATTRIPRLVPLGRKIFFNV